MARATFFDAGVVDTTSNQKKEQVIDVEDILHCSRILLFIYGLMFCVHSDYK
jgi:hypothetical protein